MNDEFKLIEKLSRIEALYSGAMTEGERDAAANALQRIRERLESIQKTDPPVESVPSSVGRTVAPVRRSPYPPAMSGSG